jgi:hypothetical protein
LPFDLLEAGKQYHFNIAEIFPVFSPSILGIIDKCLLDDLYALQSLYPKERIGEDSTIEFFLKYLYKMDIDIINDELSLLKALLYIHFNNISIPPKLLAYFEEKVQDKPLFRALPVSDLLHKRDFFIEYVVEKHKSFIENSPEVLFNKNIRKQKHNVEKILKTLDASLPGLDSNYSEWLSYSLKLSALSSNIYLNNMDFIEPLNKLYEDSNQIFTRWFTHHFAGFIQKASDIPVLVHHIPSFLVKSAKSRIALIIIDGLSLNQWFTLRDATRDTQLRYIENAAFAWVPSLTSVSRQAILSGKRPYEFEKTINTTSAEEKYWSLFWENNGLQKNEILYMKGIENDFNKAKNSITSYTTAAAFIINKVDKIVHGAQLGMLGIHNQIMLYAESGQFEEFLQSLLDMHFEIFITSDHGNIECHGEGKPNENSLANTRGERVRIYSSETLRRTVKDKFPNTLEWFPGNLPKNYFPLLSLSNNAFVKENETIVSHGSISIQESIVPFVKVERK